MWDVYSIKYYTVAAKYHFSFIDNMCMKPILKSLIAFNIIRILEIVSVARYVHNMILQSI